MKIDNLIKEAYKANDKVSLNAYRNIKSELQKVLTSKNAPEYSDTLFLQVVSKYAKRLEDAICQFKPGSEIIKEYENELEVVKKLLPKPISEKDIREVIENDEEFFNKYWVTLDNENSPEYQNGGEGTIMKLQIPKKDMGKCIKYLKDKFPTADGKLISDIIKSYIV